MGDAGLQRYPLLLNAACSGASWRLSLSGPPEPPCHLVLSGTGLVAPTLLDGAGMALLPAAQHLGRDLHLAGPVSRLGLRNMADLAGAWAAFAPAHCARIRITADSVTDDPPPPAGKALLAWDGSLHAAATLARHATTAQPGSAGVVGLVHLAGLASPDHDARVLQAARPMAAARGLLLVELRLEADPAARPHPMLGHLPLVAAALHLAGASLDPAVRLGLVARRWPYTVLLGRNRPLPHLPDLLGGATFAVQSDGGGANLGALAAALAPLPEIAAAIRPATRQEARLAALGLAAAGLPPPPCAGLPGKLEAALRLDLADPFAASAAAAMAGTQWRARAVGQLLAARVRLDGWAELAGDYARWCGALLGVRAPWPR